MSKNFYLDLPAFKTFNEFTLDNHYSLVPNDWTIIISDIQGSTQAINEGRYKEVNTIGAATIVVARKALANDFPFVFGGDGATLLVHMDEKKQVLKQLCALRKLAKDNYGLELRIGAVDMKDLVKLQAPIEISKYEITPGRSIACMRGNGMNLAEKLIKEPGSRYLVDLPADEFPDLKDLSCRWSPVPSRKGEILTLIVSSQNDASIFSQFISQLQLIIPEGLESVNPGHVEHAKYKGLLATLRAEAKQFPFFSFKFFKHCLEIFYSIWVFKLKLPAVFFDAKAYQKSIASHSDYRKFDESLRMVIDCTTEQRVAIVDYLEEQYQKGKLFYGHLITSESLMTCFVSGLGQGEHIHFIDAVNGGYAAAATLLKKQKAKRLTGSIAG